MGVATGGVGRADARIEGCEGGGGEEEGGVEARGDAAVLTGAMGSTVAVGGVERAADTTAGAASTDATGGEPDVLELRPVEEGWGTHIRPWHLGQKAYCPAICSGAERLVWQRGQSIVMGITNPL